MLDAVRDQEKERLIALLCLEAGRIMEDTSVSCALRLPTDEPELERHLERIATTGRHIIALAAAAQVLQQRLTSSPHGDAT